MKVSLSNRMQLFRMLCKRHGRKFTEHFSRNFERVRNVADAARLLRLSGHPQWAKALRDMKQRKHRNRSRWSLRSCLVEIVYRCDLESMYSSKKQAAKADAMQKARQRVLLQRELQSGRLVLPKKDTMLQHL